MATWADDISKALEELGGIAPLNEIYKKIKDIRPEPHPKDLGASVRGAIERNSLDSKAFNGENLFYSVHGIGGGIWGLRSFEKSTPIASDLDTLGHESPNRSSQETYRILRDTRLARQIKLLHKNRCQICSSSIMLPNGGYYSEAHHIIPLGNPHNGPDIAGNIIVLCPNHHVMLDYFSMKLDIKKINLHQKHLIDSNSIEYHNQIYSEKATV